MADPEWLQKAIAEGRAVVRHARPFEASSQVGKPIAGESEAMFQERVIALARSLVWNVAHFRKVRVQRKDGSVYYETPVAADGAGWPDLVLVRGNVTLFRELKTDKGRLRPEQKVWLEALEVGGCNVGTWRPGDWDRITKELT